MARAEYRIVVFMRTTKHAVEITASRIRTPVLSAIVFLMLLTACAAGEKTNESPTAQLDAEKFGLSVIINGSVYRQSEPITVAITSIDFDEGSASIIYERNPNPLYDYELTLVNQQGQSVPFTKLGERLQLTRPSHVEWVLTKDTPWRDLFRLDDLFDLSESGKYTFTLKQKVWTSLTISHELTANPVTFTWLP